jgi:PAS domain S-box-containing protein
VVLFLVTGVIDHLADSGTLSTIYTVPVGFFISYGILSTSSLESKMKDIRKNVDLLQEERKWQFMIKEMKLIIVELNTLGQIKFANPYLLEITGYTENEIIGKDWFELLLPPSHSYEVQSAFIEILSNDFHPTYQNPILTKYREEKMISWYNVRLRDQKGKITGSISIGADVTELNDSKEALERSLAEARALIEKLQKDKL